VIITILHLQIGLMLEFLEDIGDIIFGNKRLEAYKHFASSKDFRLKRKHNPEILPIDVLSMELFKQNRKKRGIKGLIYKNDTTLDILTQIFDLNYYNDLGKKTTTVFVFEHDDMHLPSFIISPKSSFGKIGNLFSSNEWADVNKEFASSFDVQTSDINMMQMMLTFQFADVMLNMKDYTVEGNGKHLAIYRKYHTTDIIDMDNIYLDGLELMDIILHDHSGEMI